MRSVPQLKAELNTEWMDLSFFIRLVVGVFVAAAVDGFLSEGFKSLSHVFAAAAIEFKLTLNEVTTKTARTHTHNFEMTVILINHECEKKTQQQQTRHRFDYIAFFLSLVNCDTELCAWRDLLPFIGIEMNSKMYFFKNCT